MTCRKRALFVLLGLAAGTVLAWTALPLQLPTVCAYKLITGEPCASCGLTHAACELARGRFVDAERFNIAAIPLAIFAAALLVGVVMELWTNRPCVAPVWKRWHIPIIVTIVALMAMAWVFHYVPGPFGSPLPERDVPKVSTPS
jgi:hypothetical protein